MAAALPGSYRFWAGRLSAVLVKGCPVLGSRAGAWNRGDATGPGALTGRSAAARPGLRLLAPAPIAAGRLRLLLIEDSRPYAALVEQMLVDALAGAVSVVHRGEVDGARRALVEGQLD